MRTRWAERTAPSVHITLSHRRHVTDTRFFPTPSHARSHLPLLSSPRLLWLVFARRVRSPTPSIVTPGCCVDIHGFVIRSVWVVGQSARQCAGPAGELEHRGRAVRRYVKRCARSGTANREEEDGGDDGMGCKCRWMDREGCGKRAGRGRQRLQNNHHHHHPLHNHRMRRR